VAPSRYPARMTKCPPPPDQPILSPKGRRASISESTVLKAAAPPAQLLRFPVRVSARSRYQGWLQPDVLPSWQQVIWPSFAFTNSPSVQVHTLSQQWRSPVLPADPLH